APARGGVEIRPTKKSPPRATFKGRLKGGYASGPSRSLAMRFIQPLFLEAAMSMRLTARRRVASSFSVPTALTADLARVRISDFTARLRSRSISFVLLRLIWLLIFATKNLVLSSPKLSGGLDKASRNRELPRFRGGPSLAQ